MADSDELAIEDTRRWVRRAVIGLNLCPFAKSVEVKGQVRYVVSRAQRTKAILVDLKRELLHLVQADPNDLDTTMLIAADGFSDFLEFNELLERADQLLVELELDGILQIASLHPHYQFADTEPDDITNFTNRSPYPTLHLLREESVDRAVAAFPNAESIFETNMETLRKLGPSGWDALKVGPTAGKLEQP